MEIMIAHDNFDARSVGIAHQRANLRFVVEQLDINHVGQTANGRLAIQLKIGFVADFRFATLFFTAEGEQQRDLFQQLANLAQRQQYLLRFSDLGEVIDAPFDNIGSGGSQRARVSLQLGKRFADQRYAD